jgi:hypothetical protein
VKENADGAGASSGRPAIDRLSWFAGDAKRYKKPTLSPYGEARQRIIGDANADRPGITEV